MAAASYTTDLASITLADVASAETASLGTVTWSEPTGATAGGVATAETDYFIHSTGCISKTFNATGLGGLGVTTGSAATIPTDGAVYIWMYFAAPNAVSSKATGGIQMIVGSSSAAYNKYYVAGADTYTYGGWVCYPVNPTITPSATQGTPTSTRQYFGWVANVANAVSKGNPFGIDVMRYGRGTLQVTAGDLANGYATFAGAASTNDLNSGTFNRWGILSFVDGGYKFQGHLLMGTAGTAVDFRDSNRSITIQNTEFVTSAFNLFEVRNASSRVDWTGISITALGTVARGNFIATDNATINKSSCTFTDMGTFSYQSLSTITSTIYRRCGTVTQGGATFTGCTFDKPNTTSAVNVSSPAALGLITNTTFNSSGTGYAITLTGTAADCTLTGVNFNGYAASNGTTGNEAIFVNMAAGTMTINITGGGNTPSIRTAGATVNISNSKTFTVTNVIQDSEVRIYRQSDLTELGGVENVASSPTGAVNVTVSTDPDNAGRFRVAYSYAYTVDTPIYVVVLNNNYQALRPSFTLKSTDTSLQVTQITDRQYLNP